MKVVVCFDSFKGSLTAGHACKIAANALRGERDALEIVTLPLADGGEGTAAVLCDALGGAWHEDLVAGPLPDREVEASWLMTEDGLAVIEIAEACGFNLVPEHRRDPLLTTTAGAGQLMRLAADAGASRIWLCLGGSATVDGGTGAASVLGWRFLDDHGKMLPPGGGALERLVRIEKPAQPFGVEVTALCDVEHPLTGPRGAARVFGPQKGATPEMVERLDRGLLRLATAIGKTLGKSVDAVPGAGAAGGFGAGAAAFFDARLARGIDVVMEAVRFHDAVADADWVVTGEGRLDAASLQGKVVSGVIRAARGARARVAVVAGQTAMTTEEIRAAGIDQLLTLAEGPDGAQRAMDNASDLLEARCRALAARLS